MCTSDGDNNNNSNSSACASHGFDSDMAAQQQQPQQQLQQPHVQHGTVAFAAASASTLTKSLLHPLDTLKSRAQSYRLRAHDMHTSSSLSSSMTSAAQQLSPHRRTSWHHVRRAYAGRWRVRDLYSGMPLKLLLYVPYQTAYMTGYDVTAHALQQQQQQQQHDVTTRQFVWHTAVAAVVAELSGCVVRVPMEAAKIRLQTVVAHNSLAALRQLRRGGVRATLRLVVPQTLLNDVPYSIVQWLVYETLRPQTQQLLQQQQQQQQQQDTTASASSMSSWWQRYRGALLQSFCSGGLSGLVASTLTLPLDNVRTRTLMLTAHAPRLRVRDVVWCVYRNEGMRGFTRGGAMRVLWVTTNMAFYFPCFELLLWLTQQQQQQQQVQQR